MAIKIKLILFLFIIYTITIFARCNKEVICNPNSVYSFEVGMKISPDKESINIGDALWMSLNESVNVEDVNTNSTIDFKNAANLGTVIAFLQFLEESNSKGAVNLFDYVLQKGSKGAITNDPATWQEYLFAETDNSYQFQLGIVARDTGRFVITISNAANVFRRSDQCTKAFFEIDYEQTNQHFSFLNKWRPDLILDEQGKKKVYYFEVVK